MLTCHEMTEEEKYNICQWKYSGEYAIYDGMPYEEQKNTVSKQLVALRSSASDNRLLRLYQNGSKSPENQGFPGFCYI